MNKYHKGILITLKEQIRTSPEEHDCTDNPGDRAFQENQMDAALD